MSTWAIYRLSDGAVVKNFTGSRRQLEFNVPEGCAALEGRVDPETHRIDPETKQLIDRTLSQVDDGVHIAQLAREELDRLERAKVRALTDHVLAPDVEIDVRGRKMLPRDRVLELEAAMVEQRKRL